MSLGDAIKKLFKAKPVEAEEPSFDERVKRFWSWWNANAAAFAADIDDGRAHEWSERLSAQLEAVDPELGWETGPGRKSTHHLAITSEGVSELRVVAERVLSRAPPVSEHWEYYAARQRSEADPIRQVEFADGSVVDYGSMRIGVEPDDLWKRLGLTLFHPAFQSIDDNRATTIAFLFLDSLLGEDDVERWVGSIDIARTEAADALAPLELRSRIDTMAADPAAGHGAIVEYMHPETHCRFLASWLTGLKRVDYLPYDHHVAIVLILSGPDDRGLCDNAELELLQDLEDELLEELGNQAVLFGHVTGHGRRSIRLQTLPMGPATATIDAWIQRHPEYEIDFTVTADPTGRTSATSWAHLPTQNDGGSERQIVGTEMLINSATVLIAPRPRFRRSARSQTSTSGWLSVTPTKRDREAIMSDCTGRDQ